MILIERESNGLIHPSLYPAFYSIHKNYKQYCYSEKPSVHYLQLPITSYEFTPHPEQVDFPLLSWKRLNDWLRFHNVPQIDPVDYPKPWIEKACNPRLCLLSEANQIVSENPGKFYIKPYITKLFQATQFQVTNFSSNTSVWLTEKQEFLAEYRFYIWRKKILYLCLYKGDMNYYPNLKEVKEYIREYAESQDSLHTYSADIGITKDGWKLVEINDGLTSGAYCNLNSFHELMIFFRWRQYQTQNEWF